MRFDEVERIEAEILSLEGKLRRAREARQELTALEPERRLAFMLHKKYCRLSHMDQCGWDYESANENCWEAGTHARFLTDAEEILAAMDRESPGQHREQVEQV